jgi:quercetin dioxygenase-like cupin family protein
MSIHDLAGTYKIAAGTGLSDVWWKGGRMAFKATGAQTGGSFAQFEAIDPRGAATPMHVHHNEDESFYVLEGEVRLLVDGERIDLVAGDYAFAPRGTAHAYVVVSERARMLTTLTPAGLEELFLTLGEPVTDGEPPARDATPPLDELVRQFGAYGCEIVGPPPNLGEL